MSFYEDQEDDWFANDCKGAPSDYYAGELAPWLDEFTDTSAAAKEATGAVPKKRSRSQKRRAQRKRAAARKAQHARKEK